MTNEKANEDVGTANATVEEKAMNDHPLTSHSQANEDVGVPRANEDVGAPRATEDVGAPSVVPKLKANW